MKIKKYRPNFFSGFEDVYYDINSKEELLESELCKYSVDNGFEICLSKKDSYSCIIAIKQDKNSKDGSEWRVLTIITNEQDVEILASWLPNFVELVMKYYELKLKNEYKL